MTKQIEIVFFKDKAFIGKLVRPAQQLSKEELGYFIRVGKDVFHANGFRATYGEHNATDLVSESNAPPISEKSGVKNLHKEESYS